MASAGKDDAATTDQPKASAPNEPQIFYNTDGRYQPLTGKNSAFDLLNILDLESDTSYVINAWK